MFVQINKDIYNSQDDVIVIKFFDDELNMLKNAPANHDIGIFCPDSTTEEKKTYYRNKLDDYISKKLKTNEQIAIDKISDENINLKKEIEDLRLQIVKPEPMESPSEPIDVPDKSKQPLLPFKEK